MSEWKEYKISNIGKVVTGKTPRTSISDNYGGTIPFLSPSDDMESKYVLTTARCLTEKGLSEVKNCLIPRNSICVSCIGSDMGKSVITDRPLVTNQQINSIIPSESFDPHFVYYLMQGKRREIRFIGRNGTAVPILNKSAFSNLTIMAPETDEQRRIASILSSLDEKIAVNRRICENLEAQAQALFKNWFIDFAPFKDGKFIESELGLIPEGWRVGTLGDLVEIIDNRGKTPPLCSESIYPIIDVKTLTGEGRIVSYEKCSKFVNQDTYNNWFRSGHPQKGDILLSTVGSLAEMKIFMGGLGCIAQNVVALRNPQKSLYLYDYLNWIKKDLLSYNIGSVQPSIKVTHIIKHKVLIPDQNILLRYQDIVKEITEKSYSNNAEITLLSNIRDNLLPKLMSGQIKINEIEKSL